MKHFKLFEEYVNENKQEEQLNEGIIDSAKAAASWAAQKLGSALVKFTNFFHEKVLKSLAEKKSDIITEGPKAGTSSINVYLPDNGSIYEQMMGTYKGTEFLENPSADNIRLNDNFEQAPKQVSESELNEEEGVSLGAERDDVRERSATQIKKEIRRRFRLLQYENLQDWNLKTNSLTGEKYREKPEHLRPVYIYGAPGIGKTQIVSQIADEFNVPLITMDLQFFNPEDLKGLPFVDYLEKAEYNESGVQTKPAVAVSRNAPIEQLAVTHKYKNGGIIFLDEFNRAKQSTFNNVMNFVQSNRLNDFSIPPNWYIVAAGNRMVDVTASGNARNLQKIEGAGVDRFSISNYTPTFAEWSDWYEDKIESDKVKYNVQRLMPEIRAFLDNDKANGGSLFHKMMGNELGNFPTPRSWVHASMEVMSEVNSRSLKDWKQIGSTPDESLEEVFEIAASHVGEKAAREFKNFLSVLLSIDDATVQKIMSNPKSVPIIQQIEKSSDKRFAVITYVLGKLFADYTLKEFEDLNSVESSSGYEDVIKRREEMVHKYRNIIEYFSKYDKLSILVGIITSVNARVPYFRATDELTQFETDQERDDKTWISQNYLYKRDANRELVDETDESDEEDSEEFNEEDEV